MAGIFVVEVHLNVVHAIKFTILHFLRRTNFKDALYHFRKIVKIAKKKKKIFYISKFRFNSKYLNIDVHGLRSSCIIIHIFDYHFQARIRIVIV